MLLRWLVNQYLREGGEGKVREVVAGLSRVAQPKSIQGSEVKVQEGKAQEEGTSEFIPCDVAFIFALGIESGGLVDLVKGAEVSRLAHGVEHAGKLSGREAVIVEGGVGQKAAARATAEAIKFYKPQWVISAGFAGGL